MLPSFLRHRSSPSPSGEHAATGTPADLSLGLQTLTPESRHAVGTADAQFRRQFRTRECAELYAMRPDDACEVLERWVVSLLVRRMRVASDGQACEARLRVLDPGDKTRYRDALIEVATTLALVAAGRERGLGNLSVLLLGDGGRATPRA